MLPPISIYISTLLLFLLLGCQLQRLEGKSLCVSGSNNFQTKVVDCESLDEDYAGVWYCSTVDVCEAQINSERVCMTTRGCATVDQCQMNAKTLDGDTFKLNGQKPGGMTISPYCCKAFDASDDDGTVIKMENICNSGSKISASILMIISITTILTYIFLI